MKLYHGSSIEIKTPDISHSRTNIDFGKGFYATTVYEQACRWANKFKDKGLDSVVSEYEFDEDKSKDFKILEFDAYSDEWLDFITNCRKGLDTTDYDIVIGCVANDRVFNTIELYIEKLIDKNEAIRRLVIEEPNKQIAFRSTEAIEECLRFVGSEKI